jgi:regulator of sigma E protease
MDEEQMKQPAQPWEFRSKPAWQRLIIMLGGIIVNILLAWFIYTTMFATVGQKYVSTEAIQKNGLAFGDVGKSVGFKNGDKIISVDGKLQPKFNWMIIDVLLSDKIELERDGKRFDLVLTDEQKGEIISTEGREFVQPRLTQPIVDSLLPKSEAMKAGFRKGDVILAVDQKPLAHYDELQDELKAHKNDSVSITVKRDNADVVIRALVNKEGKLGFKPKFSDREDYIIVKDHSIATAVPAAVKESWQLFVYNIKQFKLILKPKTGAYKQVKSPVGIARQLPDTWNWEFIWNFTALFSIGLAFMNLLPIPGLDGGHALFTIAEMVTGRKLSDKAMGYVQTGGMIILLTLMALTFGKDIYQLIADKLF